MRGGRRELEAWGSSSLPTPLPSTLTHPPRPSRRTVALDINLLIYCGNRSRAAPRWVGYTRVWTEHGFVLLAFASNLRRSHHYLMARRMLLPSKLTISLSFPQNWKPPSTISRKPHEIFQPRKIILRVNRYHTAVDQWIAYSDEYQFLFNFMWEVSTT